MFYQTLMLHLTCDRCQEDGTYQGRTEYEAHLKARKAGWRIFVLTRRCRCRSCEASGRLTARAARAMQGANA